MTEDEFKVLVGHESGEEVYAALIEHFRRIQWWDAVRIVERLPCQADDNGLAEYAKSEAASNAWSRCIAACDEALKDSDLDENFIVAASKIIRSLDGCE